MSLWDTTRNVSGHLAFSNANKDVTYTGTAGTDAATFSTNFHSSGKWVARFNVIAAVSGHTEVGLADSTASSAANQYLGIDTHGIGFGTGGKWLLNNSATQSGSTGFVTGDIVDIAVDLGGQLIWARTNGGTWWGTSVSGNPDTGSNGFSIASLASFTLSPACDLFGGTPNDQIDIGVQSSSTTTFATWDPFPDISAIGMCVSAYRRPPGPRPLFRPRPLWTPPAIGGVASAN